MTEKLARFERLWSDHPRLSLMLDVTFYALATLALCRLWFG